MSGFEAIWQGRARPFVDAAQDYVERVAYTRPPRLPPGGSGTSGTGRGRGANDGERSGLEGGNARRLARADTLRLRVMRKLVTAERYELIFNFSQFLWLSRGAGVDPFEPCIDPPVTIEDVRHAFGQAIAAGRVAGDSLSSPGVAHEIHLVAVPELCCFGYILSSVMMTTLLDVCVPPSDRIGHHDYVTAVNRRITQGISALEDELGFGDYEARMLHELVDAIREQTGGDFEPTTLEDDLVLAVWEARAGKHGSLRFTRMLAELASLTAEYVRGMAQKATRSARGIDDPALADRIDAVPNELSADDEVAAGLLVPCIRALLTKDERDSARMQLVTLGGLRRLYLSRARAETFGPLENKVIQAKKNRTDLAAPLDAARTRPTHGDSLAILAKLIAKLAQLADACSFLLWQNGHRLEALRVGIARGRLTHADVSDLVGDVVDFAEDSEEAFRAALDAVAPSAPVQAMLDMGKAAWQWLRRRDAFAAFQQTLTAEGGEALAHDASRLCQALTRQTDSLAAAVGTCNEGDGFVRDYETFCAALAAVHGISFASTRVS